MGRLFSLFDLVYSFYQIIARKDTIPLTSFCTPTGLYEWLVMPQGSSASPVWFVKVINEVIKGLEQVAAYLNDVIVFDSDPTAHVKTMRTLFERLRTHYLKISPSKARLGATDAALLGHSISPTGVRPHAEKAKQYHYTLLLAPTPRPFISYVIRVHASHHHIPRGRRQGGAGVLPNRLTPGYYHHRHDASPLLRPE